MNTAMRCRVTRGMWVGFKAISETVEAGASMELTPDRIFNTPDFSPAARRARTIGGRDLPGPQIEQRMAAKKAVQAFARGQSDRPAHL